MELIHFRTKISRSGTIKLPENFSLFDKEVDVIIFPKIYSRKRKLNAGEFVKKWAGFLHLTDIEDVKYMYLMEKYK